MTTDLAEVTAEVLLERVTHAHDRMRAALAHLVATAGPVIEDQADTATWNEAVCALTKARDVLAGAR